MRRLVCMLMALTVLCSAAAQNSRGATDDFGRIALTPVISDASKVPSYASKTLETKLTQIVTKNGMASKSVTPRFVITANIDLLNKEVTATAPSMTVVEVATTLYIGDAQTGQLFASYTYDPVKGVGTNETRAYLEALKRVTIAAPGVNEFVNDGKNKIIEYYNSQIDFLLAEADGLAKSQEYDKAMLLLASVPDVCKEAYTKAMDRLGVVYQQKIDNEGMALYNKAMAIWKTSKSEASAREASEILSEINPESMAAVKATALVNEIESHYKALENERKAREQRNWEFKQRQYADKQAAAQEIRQLRHDVDMARIESGAASSERALEEVKSMVGVMSNVVTSANAVRATQSAASSFGAQAFANIASWFN